MNNQILDHKEIEIEAFHPGEFLKEEIEEREMLKKRCCKSIEYFAASFK
jgi:hypothetical protein